MCVQSCVACNLCQISSRSPPLPLSAPWSSTKQKRLGESDSVKCCSPAFTFCVMGGAGMACHSLPWVCEACLEWDASRYKSVTVFTLMCVFTSPRIHLLMFESQVSVWGSTDRQDTVSRVTAASSSSSTSSLFDVGACEKISFQCWHAACVIPVAIAMEPYQSSAACPHGATGARCFLTESPSPKLFWKDVMEEAPTPPPRRAKHRCVNRRHTSMETSTQQQLQSHLKHSALTRTEESHWCL